MARKTRKSRATIQRSSPSIWQRIARLPRLVLRAALGLISAVLLWVLLYGFLPVPTTIYILQESYRIGGVERDWVPIEDISPHLQRSVVAAEDANYCLHWGFDMDAIRDAIEDGGTRGASTISQQTVKNAFLWHGRNWARKALEALITPVMEGLWSKRRILEVYLNVAEFDEGVFGAEAAAQHHFGVSAAELSPIQAARLAAVLPAPQDRSAIAPTPWLERRAASILDGAETIRADGRDGCFAN